MGMTCKMKHVSVRGLLISCFGKGILLGRSSFGDLLGLDKAKSRAMGVVVDLLFNVHGKHRRSCRDGQLT